MNPPPERLARAPGTTFRRLGDSVVLAAPSRDDFDLLAGSAADVWLLLEESRSIAELVDILSRRYPGTTEAIERDLRDFVERMRSAGAVEVLRGDE